MLGRLEYQVNSNARMVWTGAWRRIGLGAILEAGKFRVEDGSLSRYFIDSGGVSVFDLA